VSHERRFDDTGLLDGDRERDCSWIIGKAEGGFTETGGETS
jgi:hypothetical protein